MSTPIVSSFNQLNTFNQIAPLIIQQYENYLPTAFDNSLSLLQKVNKIIQFLNTSNDTINSDMSTVVDSVNTLITEWNSIIDWVENDGLNQDVINKLDQMSTDGTLKSLINIDILGNLSALETNDKTSVVNAINENVSKLATKSDKTYVDGNVATLQSQIQSVSSGSPKGVYATLSALQTAYPTGNTNIFLVTADGGWYYWSGSAWTKGGTYQGNGISLGSITPNLTSFIQEGVNKFNASKCTLTTGSFMQGGSLIANGNYSYTSHIPLLPNTQYTISASIWGSSATGARGSMFDANGSYIGAWDNVTQTTPSNFSYVVFTVYNSSYPNLNNFMIVVGTTVPSVYTPYTITLDQTINIPSIQNLTVTPSQTNFLSVSANILDLTLMGNPTTGNYIQNGSLVANANYNVTSPIYLKPNTTYTLSQPIWGSSVAGARGGMFDSNGSYIGAWDNVTQTTPYNFSFVKFTQYVPTYPNLNNLMIVIGTTVPSSYVPFSITLSSEVTLPQLNQFQAFSYPVYVKRTGNTVSVSSKYNASNDLQVTIKPVGQSLLPQIASLDLKPNTAHNVLNDFTNVTNIVTIGTDLVGPYVVLAKNNITGSLPNSSQFTGGWHGYNGDQTGNKTANNHKLDLYVDGIKNNADGSYGGSEVKVVVVNGIYASNTMNADGTGREVLQEYVTYTFTPNGEIKVENRIEFSEDVSLHTYYGMQMTMDSYFSNKLLFVGDNLQTKWISPPNQDLTGGNKTQSYCNKMILTNNNNYFEAEIEEFAIGNRQFISSTDSVVFSTAYNKAYFRLVDWCDFTQGQVLNWRGHYKWYYKE